MIELLLSQVTSDTDRGESLTRMTPTTRPSERDYKVLKWSRIMNPAEDQEPFVTPEEAASFLRISPVTVKKMARGGYLPAHPIGNGVRKRWRFRISELVSHMRCPVQSESSSVRALRRKAS